MLQGILMAANGMNTVLINQILLPHLPWLQDLSSPNTPLTNDILLPLLLLWRLYLEGMVSEETWVGWYNLAIWFLS